MQNASELEVGKMKKDSMMVPQFLNVFRIVKAKILFSPVFLTVC